MASRPPPTAEAAQAAQAALAAQAAETVLGLWPALLGDLSRFMDAAVAEVRSSARASGALAQRQYRRQRAAAGELDPFRPRIAALPTPADIEAAIREATADVLADLGIDLDGDLGLDLPDIEVPEPPGELADVVGDAVFDTGVRTVLANADRDRKALGYARIPEANACAFCLMLATRGAVYKAERNPDGRGRQAGDSFAQSNNKIRKMRDGTTRAFIDGTLPSSIKVHDNCRCQPEPVFGIYEAPARVREAEALWIEVGRRRDARGRDNHRLRFRQAVEGRLPPDTDQ